MKARATHFTRAEAKALSLSILGWGAIAKPETVARMRKPKPAGQFQSEHVLQIAVAEYLDRALPPDAWWTSIDFAGRGPIQGARMKRRGVKRGLPDILVIAGRGSPYAPYTIWFELKSDKGRPTAEQKQFQEIAQASGHWWRIARSVETVQEVLEYAGIPLRARLS